MSRPATYHAPPPNLVHGIHLAQAGRRAEALAYLRQAARSEALNAEGWLWLAAATDDLEEYRYCVLQALRLDRSHPIAVRMRGDLERLEQRGYLPPGYLDASVAPYDAGTTAVAPAYSAEPVAQSSDTLAYRRPAGRRRLLRVLGALALIAAFVVAVAALVMSDAVQHRLRDALGIQAMHTLDITIGAPPGYHFRVEVPDTWIAANAEDPAWHAARERLTAAFPPPAGGPDVWAQIEASFSAVARDAVYGTLEPQPRLVETDADRLREQGVVAALALREIVPLPAPPDGVASDVCARLALLETQWAASASLAVQPNAELIDSGLIARRAPDDCAAYAHWRYTGQAPHQVLFALDAGQVPDATREVVIAVPAGAERCAVWHLTFADPAHDDYAHLIRRALRTLRYQADL